MKPKTLLVLGAGLYYIRVIQELKQLGYRTVVVDHNQAAPGLAFADAYEVVDIVDCENVLEVATKHAVDGVMPVNDFGVRAAAYVTKALNLVGIDTLAAERANDKGLMRECWQQAKLPIPSFRIIRTLEEAQSTAFEFGFPLIMKPTDCGGGGRGVSIIQSDLDVIWAYAFARPFAKNGRIIIEQFLDGIEMTIESLSYKGVVHVLAMSDKRKPPLRTPVATSLNYPASFPDTILDEVRTLVQQAVRALGVTNGPAHTEVIVTVDGPKLVETGARGGGGHIFSTIVHAASGVNMIRETARILTSDIPDLSIKYQRGCVYRFFNPPKGIIKAIHGLEVARTMPGVLDIGVVKKVGDTVGDLVNSLERVGFAVVAGKDRYEAICRADAVEQTIVFDIVSAVN